MKPSQNQKVKRPAISYLRYSTKTQAQGGSEKRQLDWTEEYCEANNLILKDTYKDLGVSGYRGKHSKEGKLATLIKDCESGKIPKGYVLIIENFDRLSREEVPKALQRFLCLINDHELEIHTLDDNMIYAPNKLELTELIISIVIMGRAHGESERKSKLTGRAWEKKRTRKKAFSEPGKSPMGRHPNWLNWNDKKQQWIVDQKAAKTIKYIFELCTKENLGRYQIAQRLVEEKIPVFSNRANSWTAAMIKRITNNQSLLGKLVCANSSRSNDQIIEDYYPRVISDKLFEKTQKSFNSRNSHTTGRPSKNKHAHSILTGIAQYKGSKAHKGYYKTKAGVVNSTYCCTLNNRNKYIGHADPIDHFVTSLIQELDDKELSSNSNTNSYKKKIESDVDKTKKLYSASKDKLNNLIQAVVLGEDIPQLVKEMKIVEIETSNLKEQLTDLHTQIADLKTGTGIHDRELVSKLKDQALNKKDLQSRQKLQTSLKQLISTLDLYKDVEDLPEEENFKNMAIMIQADTPCKYWARIKLFNDAIILGAMTANGKIARIRWDS